MTVYLCSLAKYIIGLNTLHFSLLVLYMVLTTFKYSEPGKYSFFVNVKNIHLKKKLKITININKMYVGTYILYVWCTNQIISERKKEIYNCRFIARESLYYY